MEQIVIAGAGCAGFTAAIYAARAELAPLVITGDVMGGQLSETTSVENYPGFPDGIMGPEVMDNFKKQAKRFGARTKLAGITSCNLRQGGPHSITLTNDETIEARTLIVATGARPSWLGLESEQALRNRGVSSCATCDGALYRGVPVVVVGGGDTAMEEAGFLSRFASEVVVIHRRDKLRASKIMQERAFENPKIRFQWNSVIREVLDVNQNEVTGVLVADVESGKETVIDCSAMFLAIGHLPNTEAFEQLERNREGYIVLPDGARSFTNLDAVFAAGDCADHVYRQAVTAAGMGCRAAIDAERWLQAHQNSDLSTNKTPCF